MSGGSEAISDRTPSMSIGLDDDLSSHSRLRYSSDNSLVSDRESTSNPSSEEASPSRWQLRRVILPNNWSIHDFLVDMSDDVFGRLRPHFYIPDSVPIRKCDIGEKCYDGTLSNMGFYEAAFIAGLHLPLFSLHRQFPRQAFPSGRYLNFSIGLWVGGRRVIV